MKPIIVSTCLKTIMNETAAARVAEVCSFNESTLAAILGGVAIRIVGYNADALKTRIKCVSIEDVQLFKESQTVTVYFKVKRYAKTEGETEYYNTYRVKNDIYPYEVNVVTSETFDVDALLDVVEFEYI